MYFVNVIAKYSCIHNIQRQKLIINASHRKIAFLKPPTFSTLRANIEAITKCQSQMTNWSQYQHENLPAEIKFIVTLASRGCTVYEEMIYVVKSYIWKQKYSTPVTFSINFCSKQVVQHCVLCLQY